MAKGLNKAMLIGFLGKDPEIRYTQDGRTVANFSIATNEEWKDRNTGEKKKSTEWHRLVAFGKLGEICGQYLQKGKLVYVEGKLQTRSWEQDGVMKYSTEVVVAEMQMLDSGGGHNQGQGYQAASAPASGGPGDFDEDIPF